MKKNSSWTDHDYATRAERSGVNGVKWNAVALAGRQSTILIFSVVLARLLGPEAYGIIAQATVYIALTTLILDQGLTAALVSRTSVTRAIVASAAGLNLLLALTLVLISFVAAEPLANFFRTPELRDVLIVLGLGLLFKAGAIVPRLLLTRLMDFRAIAFADVLSTLSGGVAGVLAAYIGLDYWSLVLQIMVTDAMALAILLIVARPPLPSLKFAVLREDSGYSVRVFFGNLVSFASRNTDNILIGRFFGASELAYYSLAYRVLLTPIQMVGQVVTRVLFPAIARARSDLDKVRSMVLSSTRTIAFVAFPAMGFIAVSASDSIPLLLGDSWLPVVPVLQVLALTGARQAFTSVNAPILLGMDKSHAHLKFNLVAAFVQIAGMVVGMPWGIFGVAVGYTVAGVALTPIVISLQARFVGLSAISQLRVVMPQALGTALGAAAYLTLYSLDIGHFLRLLLGFILGLTFYTLYLYVGHRKTVFKPIIADLKRVIASNGKR